MQQAATIWSSRAAALYVFAAMMLTGANLPLAKPGGRMFRFIVAIFSVPSVRHCVGGDRQARRRATGSRSMRRSQDMDVMLVALMLGQAIGPNPSAGAALVIAAIALADTARPS